VTHLYLTEIQEEVEGDRYFPEIDEQAWQETERSQGAEGMLVFRTLVRRRV
jgi:dihydrofolate reductase